MAFIPIPLPIAHITSRVGLRLNATAAPAFDLSCIAREQLPEASRNAAAKDPDFTALLASSAASAAAGRWRKVAEFCVRALALYPYHASSWLQLARARANERAFGAAEIAWRTAAAYGADEDAVQAGLATALRQQNVAAGEWPLHRRRPGGAAQQVPGQPDIALLARLAWQVSHVNERNCLRLLRTCATLDATFATMIADQRFARANIGWLSVA